MVDTADMLEAAAEDMEAKGDWPGSMDMGLLPSRAELEARPRAEAAL